MSLAPTYTTPATHAAEVVGQAGLTVVESSLLGAFAGLCLAIAVVAIIVAWKTQNLRVSDQKKLSDKLEGLYQQQSTCTANTTVALEKLAVVEEKQSSLLEAILQKQESCNDSIGNLVAGLVRRD